MAGRVEDHAGVRGAKGCDRHVEAAAGTAVLVHEQDRRTRAAHLAVEAHSIDGSDRAHSALNPEVFTTCAHFATSMRMTSENCSGELAEGSKPCAEITSRISEDA